MRVDELGNLSRRSLPVVDQLSFGDQFPYPGADQVNAEHRAASGSGDDFRRALSLQDLALAVAGQIVGELGGLDATLRGGRGGDAHRCDLRIAVGDPRDAVVVDRGDRKSTRLNSSHLGISYAVFCLKK